MRAAPQSGPTLSEASDRFIHQTLLRGVSAPVRIRPRPPKGPRSIPLGSAADPPPGVSQPASRRPVRHPHAAPRGNGFRPSEGPPSNRNPRRGPLSSLPAPNHPSAELPGCPVRPDSHLDTVSRAPIQPAGLGHPIPASLAWAVIAFLGGNQGIGPRPPVLRPASSGSFAPPALRPRSSGPFAQRPEGPLAPAPSPAASRPPDPADPIPYRLVNVPLDVDRSTRVPSRMQGEMGAYFHPLFPHMDIHRIHAHVVRSSHACGRNLWMNRLAG